MKHVKEIIAEAIFLISALASIFAVAIDVYKRQVL